MKRQKTLHRFAAVAVVLLTLCLVFATPVSADQTTISVNQTTISVNQTTFVDFGSVNVGYNITEMEKFIFVHNTGNTTITLNVNVTEIENFINTTKIPTTKTLNASESFTITIQPKTGLNESNYYGNITLNSTTTNTEIVIIPVYFTVTDNGSGEEGGEGTGGEEPGEEGGEGTGSDDTGGEGTGSEGTGGEGTGGEGTGSEGTGSEGTGGEGTGGEGTGSEGTGGEGTGSEEPGEGDKPTDEPEDGNTGEDKPQEITPDFDEVIQEEGKEIVITINKENVKPEGNVVTIEDEKNGVTMTVTFTSTPAETENGVKGTVAKVQVTYNEKTTEVASGTGTVTYEMVLDLTQAGITLPTLNPKFDEEKGKKITDTPGLSKHIPLAMITAKETEAVNDDMKANSGNQITLTFKIEKSLLDGKTMKHLVGYHIADDGKVTKIVPNSGDRKEDNNYIYVTIYGDKFSTYAVGLSDKEEEIITSTGGSTSGSTGGGSSNTGSGNYNEYPRQADGKAGEISFGTSKTVKSVDLPAGVTGEVKLIAKSTNPGPEGKNIFHVFEINIPNYPTGEKATIKFEMTLAEIEAKGLTAADVCLYHFNKETGLWEKLPTTYKVVDGKVYFESVTTGFSPFAIVFEEGAATPAAGEDKPVTPPTETPDVPNTPGTLPPTDTPDTPETPASPAPILAVLAGLGAVAALRRK